MNGSNRSYNCTPFLHSLLTKGKMKPNIDDPKSLLQLLCGEAAILTWVLTGKPHYVLS